MQYLTHQHATDSRVRLASGVELYSLSAIRLIAVGPTGRRFRDAHIDLRGEPQNARERPNGPARFPHSGGATLVLGDNSTGKTLIAQLVKLVVSPRGNAMGQSRRSFAECFPIGRAGHVMLEWEDRESEERLVTALSREFFPETPKAVSREFHPEMDNFLHVMFNLVGPARLRDVTLPIDATLRAALQQLKGLEAAGQARDLRTFNQQWSWRKQLASHGITADTIHLISNEIYKPASTYGRLRDVPNSKALVEQIIRATVTESDVAELKRLQKAARAQVGEDVSAMFAELIVRLLGRLQLLEELSSLSAENGPERRLFRFAIDMPTDGQLQYSASRLITMRLPSQHEDAASSLAKLVVESVSSEVSVSVLEWMNNGAASSSYISFERVGQRSGYYQSLICCALDILTSRLRVAVSGEATARLVVILDIGDAGWFELLADGIRSWGVQMIYLTWRTEDTSAETFDSIHYIYPPDRMWDTDTPEVSIRQATTLPTALSQQTRIRAQPDPLEEVRLDTVFQVLDRGAASEVGDFLVPQFRWAGRAGGVIVCDGKSTGYSRPAQLLLRPLRPLIPTEQEFYARFLGSDALLGHGVDAGQLVAIHGIDLEAAPLLRPDGETLHAMAELAQAGAAFTEWQREAASAADAFFWQRDVHAGRAAIISAGRLTRQRRETAHILDERSSRIRATMPFPIATRWRAVEAARPDENGYRRILDCAETTVTYCAAVGVQLALGLPGAVNINALSAKVRQGAPLPWGVWTTLLAELGRAGGNGSLPADSPLRSFRKLVDEADLAVRSLKQRRNDLAHQRVPPTHQIAAQAADARAELEVLLGAAEWLSDYPLRHIEEVHWDSYSNESVVHFRELMGDHHVVALKSGRTSGNMEVSSPYAADQFGRYHLLRPLFHTEHCGSCGQLSVFVLDRWIEAKQAAEYKALDHGDTCRVLAGSALRGAGILPR